MAAKLVEEGTGAENAAFGLSLGTKSEEDIIDIYGKRYDTDGSNIHREALRRCNQYLLGARREETLQVAWPIISINEFGLYQERLMLLSNKAAYRVKWDFKTKRVSTYSRTEYDEMMGITFGPLYQGLAKTKKLALQIFTRKQDGRRNWPAFYQEEKGQEFYRVYCPLVLTDDSPNEAETVKEMVECIIYLGLRPDRAVTLSVKKSGLPESLPDMEHCVKNRRVVEKKIDGAAGSAQLESGAGGGAATSALAKAAAATSGSKREKEKGKKVLGTKGKLGEKHTSNDKKDDEDRDEEGVGATQVGDETQLILSAQNVCFVHQGGAVAYLANRFGAGLWSKVGQKKS